MPVVTIEVPAFGNRTHLVHDGRTAIAVDPPRDCADLERAAEDAGVDLVAVADTHVHNDYVSGGLALARRHGADYLLAADEAVAFERVGVRAGEVLTYGDVHLEVIASPGHTRHHQSFRATVGNESALFSGGSLLLGTVGRTDLVDPRLALHLAGSQWDTVRALAALDPATLLLPTHGFGSFCAASTVTASQEDGPATIGGQLETHPALLTDRASFAADLVAGFGPIPAYYDHMDPLNRAGAGTPRPARLVTADQVAAALSGGRWVVDTRTSATHAQGHLRGSVGFQYGDQFATYVGWLVPWGDELVLLADEFVTLEAAVAQLAGIGIEGVDGHLLGRGVRFDSSFRRADWSEFARAQHSDQQPVVVDVRQADEWSSGHLLGAINVPIQDLERAAAGLPAGELWVHCKSGYRAGIAASLLHRLGHDVVHVDDAWERVGELALPTIPTAA
jgi:glyoxylase-like metal-dependent hydrolase (beta-lactamase superfamily II)/rhodanese-related sulfurtransferase